MNIRPGAKDRYNPEKEKVLRELSQEKTETFFVKIPQSLKIKLDIYIAKNKYKSQRAWFIDLLETYIDI